MNITQFLANRYVKPDSDTITVEDAIQDIISIALVIIVSYSWYHVLFGKIAEINTSFLYFMCSAASLFVCIISVMFTVSLVIAYSNEIWDKIKCIKLVTLRIK